MIMDKIETLIEKLKTRKAKNVIYLIVIFFVVTVFGFRFYMVAHENNRAVFNIFRNNLENGTPVQVIAIQETDGVLYEPLNIKNNRAYVSWARLNMFHPGQKIDGCKIISVSKNIDLYSGMHIIKTANCVDGLHYVECIERGVYIPVSAVHNNKVYVAEGNKASVRNIEIQAHDSHNVLVKSGLNNNDIVILSNVTDNEKIKIVK